MENPLVTPMSQACLDHACHGTNHQMPQFSGVTFPMNIEFQVQIDVMVAIQKRHSTRTDKYGIRLDYVPPRYSHLRAKGEPILPPPCVFNYNSPGIPPINPAERYANWVLYTLAQAIRKKELKTNYDSSSPPTNSYKPTLESKDDLDTVWSVALTPGDLREHQETEYDWISVRIASPVYGPGNKTSEIIQDLQQVLQILNDDFITFAHTDSRLTILVRPEGASFTLEQVKNVASLLWVIDPILNKVHPPHCGPGSFPSLGLQFTVLGKDMIEPLGQNISPQLVEDPWNNRLMSHRRRLQQLQNPGDLNQPGFAHKLPKIRETRDFAELNQLLDIATPDSGDILYTKPYRAAYGFHRIDGESEKPMLEFSQHCGTLNLEAIVHWTAVCAQVVGSSCSSECPQNFQVRLQQQQHGIREEGVSLTDLLNQNGLRTTARYYESRDPELQIPDLESWPILRNAISDDDSEPKIDETLAQLYRRGSIDAEAQRDELAQDVVLGLFEDSIDNWNKPSVANNPDSRYTMGIEIEMLLPTQEGPPPATELGNFCPEQVLESYRNPNPSDPRAYAFGKYATHGQQIVAALEKLGAPSRLAPYEMDDSTDEDRMGDTKKYLRGKNLLYQTYAPYNYQAWTVEKDCSLTECEDWKGYSNLKGIELASPIYRDRPECWESILGVVSGLRREMRIVTDLSCGFHVSVGTGANLMTFAFLKRLVCASFLADRVIFSLCNPIRSIASDYCKPLRDQSQLALEPSQPWQSPPVTPDFAELFPVDELSDDECIMLKRVWTVGKHIDLANLLSSPMNGRSSVSINRLTPADGDYLSSSIHFSGAVEFRYLEGNLDPELILRYCQLMVALFKFADTAKPEAWQAYTSNLLKCKDTWAYDLTILKQFLEHVGMSEDYAYWEERVKMNTANVPSVLKNEDWHKAYQYDAGLKQEGAQSVDILPKVPEEHVEFLRETVCLRKKFADYKNERTGDVHPETTTTDTKTDLQARTRALFEGPNDPDSPMQLSLQKFVDEAQTIEDLTETYLQNRLSELDLFRQGADPKMRAFLCNDLVTTCAEAYASHGIQAALNAMDRFRQIDEVSPEMAQVSHRELNTFVGLDEYQGSMEAFIFDSITRVQGPVLEVSITEDDMKRFLQD
ncbi:Fc.00g061810.m01.CDS01 [Cosmosporella sp. VM-42]